MALAEDLVPAGTTLVTPELDDGDLHEQKMKCTQKIRSTKKVTNKAN